MPRKPANLPPDPRAGQPKRKPVPQKAAAPGEPGMTDEIRVEIVTRLAMFDGPTEIAQDLVDRGIDISKQSVAAYNPMTSHGNRRLSQKWVELFHTTREGFLKEIAAEPIAHRAWRLRRLTEDYYRARGGAEPDLEVARKILEQAAKETGNVYTNVAKVTGSVAHTHTHIDRTPDENRNILADRLKEAIARLPKPEAKRATKH